MASRSVWHDTSNTTARPALKAPISVDVAVVGGGITGVTTALLLARAGRSVVLLEAGRIGGGDTGSSTGNLYATTSDGLHTVRAAWDAEVARSVVAARAETIDFIEREVQQAAIPCGFARCALHRYAREPDAEQDIEDEHEALREAGVPVQWIDALPPGPPPAHGKVLVVPNQAQCHPAAWVQGVAVQAEAAGARLFEQSPALEFDAATHRVRTALATVEAREIVLATHSPSGFHVMQAAMVPNREYGLAAPLREGSFPLGIFWAEGRERLSVRGTSTPAGSFVIVVGEDHPTGRHDALAAMAELENAAYRRLALSDVAYRWSAQNFRSPDVLPYVGRDASGCHVATGFAADGLVWGTLAARVIADAIAGTPNRWAEMLRVGRFTPLKSAKGFVEETAAVVKSVVQDRLGGPPPRTLDSLRGGEGAIVEVGGERLAAFRDARGELLVVSPVCTHMKCLVHWNGLEASWDCPCHGSRFAPDGRVIEGPAIRPLERRQVPV